MQLPLPQTARRDSAGGLLLGAALGAGAVSGHAPLWMLPVWALALGLWCLNERRRGVVFALPVLLALLPAWPLHADLLAFTSDYLRVVLAGLAVALFVTQLGEQHAWLGLAALALAFVLAPGPLPLLGLVGAALLRAQTIQRGLRLQTSPRAWAWLAAGVVVLALASALLPRPLPMPGTATTAGAHQQQSQVAVAAKPPAHPRPGLAAAQPSRPTPNTQEPSGLTAPEKIIPYVLLAFGVMVSVLLVQALRERRQRGEPLRVEDLVLTAALLVAFVMLMLYSLAGQSPPSATAGGDAGGAALPSPLVRLVQALSQLVHLPDSVVRAAAWLALASGLLFILVAVAATVLLLRLRPTREGSGDAPPSGPLLQAATPEDRVRRAYRQLLALLAGAGLARAEAETPQEFLARLRLARPELHADAATITTLYEPVRYGDLTGEPGASAAEAALDRLRSVLAPDSGTH